MSENQNPKQASSPKPKRKKKPAFYKPLLLLQLAASVTCYLLARSYLPVIWRAGLLLLLAFLLYLCLRLIFTRKKFNRYLGKVLSFSLSLLLFMISLYTSKGSLTLDDITADGDVETKEVFVVALKSSGYIGVSDLKGTIAYNRSYDEELSANVIELLEKDLGHEPEIDSYSQFDYLKNALYNKTVDAIFFSGTYRDFLYRQEEDPKDTFEKDTLVLATYTFTTGNTIASSAVNNITKDCFMVYISGIDTRSKELTASSRSDSNHLLVVNPKTKQILFISIPRDYYINIPAEGKKDKLTHSGNFGVNASIGALEELLEGEKINYYVRLNFAAAVNVIDALGGVDVYSPVAFTTLDDKFEIAQGVNHMSGKMALYFMRTRYGLKGGDNARVKNQARVMKAVLKKVMSFSAVSNFNDLLNAASTSSKTNMSSREIRDLIKMQIDEMCTWDIQNYQLTGDGTQFNEKKQSIMVPDQESVEQAISLIKKMKAGEILNLEELDA